MKVAVASASPEKINGIKEGFERFFNTDEIEIVFQEVESGVSKQPFGVETFQGASNRICQICKRKSN